jgi:hypothetical protein
MEGRPAYRLEQAYSPLTYSLVKDWEEATNLPKRLRVACCEGPPSVPGGPP